MDRLHVYNQYVRTCNKKELYMDTWVKSVILVLKLLGVYLVIRSLKTV